MRRETQVSHGHRPVMVFGGADTLRQRDHDRIRRRAIAQLEKLGHTVTTLSPSAAAVSRRPLRIRP